MDITKIATNKSQLIKGFWVQCDECKDYYEADDPDLDINLASDGEILCVECSSCNSGWDEDVEFDPEDEGHSPDCECDSCNDFYYMQEVMSRD